MKLVMLIVDKYNERKQICSTKFIHKVVKIQAKGFDQVTDSFLIKSPGNLCIKGKGIVLSKSLSSFSYLLIKFLTFTNKSST